MRPFVLTVAILIMAASLPCSAGAITPSASAPEIPIPPGGGDNGLHDLLGMHGNMRNNTTITGFIDAHGLGGWYEGTAYEGYKYVYLRPADNYSRKLVYLNKNVDEWHINNSIVWIKLVDRDEALPPLNESEARALGIGDNSGSATAPASSDAGKVGVSAMPDFTLRLAIASIAISLLIFSRKKKMNK